MPLFENLLFETDGAADDDEDAVSEDRSFFTGNDDSEGWSSSRTDRLVLALLLSFGSSTDGSTDASG